MLFYRENFSLPSMLRAGWQSWQVKRLVVAQTSISLWLIAGRFSSAFFFFLPFPGPPTFFLAIALASAAEGGK